MASELLEFEDNDSVNDETGPVRKRPATTSVTALEKKEKEFSSRKEGLRPSAGQAITVNAEAITAKT